MKKILSQKTIQMLPLHLLFEICLKIIRNMLGDRFVNSEIYLTRFRSKRFLLSFSFLRFFVSFFLVFQLYSYKLIVLNSWVSAITPGFNTWLLGWSSKIKVCPAWKSENGIVKNIGYYYEWVPGPWLANSIT